MVGMGTGMRDSKPLVPRGRHLRVPGVLDRSALGPASGPSPRDYRETTRRSDANSTELPKNVGAPAAPVGAAARPGRRRAGKETAPVGWATKREVAEDLSRDTPRPSECPAKETLFWTAARGL